VIQYFCQFPRPAKISSARTINYKIKQSLRLVQQLLNFLQEQAVETAKQEGKMKEKNQGGF
jgi:hypothetical protein